MCQTIILSVTIVLISNLCRVNEISTEIIREIIVNHLTTIPNHHINYVKHFYYRGIKWENQVFRTNVYEKFTN